MSTGRYDALFATLAQQHDGVEALLDSFFDFMHRKTDFYVVTRDPKGRKMGFLPGHAEQKVLQAFRKYPLKDLDGTLASASTTASRSARPSDHQPLAAPPQQPQQQAPPSAAHSRSVRARDEPNPKVKRTESGKQLPVGNGGSTDAYTWTQSLDETTIYLTVPPGTRSKDLECTITATRVRVRMKSAAPDAPPLLDGAFPEKIRADESLWSLERDATQLQLSLEKIKKTWWASALVGDDEIDTSQVDSKRDIHEYDSETQGAIRKAMFDQQQTQAGRPTSDEMQLQALMAQAQRAPNAPI